jgi:hypothetical protein
MWLACDTASRDACLYSLQIEEFLIQLQHTHSSSPQPAGADYHSRNGRPDSTATFTKANSAAAALKYMHGVAVMDYMKLKLSNYDRAAQPAQASALT